jgi:hypothetical protein
MKKSLAVRAATAAALWTATAGAALASEGPEGMGEMGGMKPLLIIVGGVAIMAVVIWLGLKLMNKK